MVRFDTVTKRYNADIVALEDIYFEIDSGEFCFVTGPSGAGKSTILKLLIRDEIPTTGTIFYDDIEVPKIPRKMLPSYRQKLGVVFQDMKLLEKRSLSENIAFALEILKKSPKEIKDTTDYLLELVGLENRRNLLPPQLSGGEQQRGAIARALASNPSLFLADEPTGNLDDENAFLILDILKKINDSGTTVMVITHDMALVDKTNGTARKMHLKDGKLIDDNRPEKKVKKSIEKKKQEIDPELKKLSKGLLKKFEKNAVYTNDVLLNLTESDLKNLDLNSKEKKELEKYVKDYLKKETNETKS